MSKGLLFVAVIALMDVVAQNFQKDKINDDFDDQTIHKDDFHYLILSILSPKSRGGKHDFVSVRED